MQFNVLHLTDIHFGQRYMSALWPTIQRSFKDDVLEVCREVGPLDLIAITGDITNRASEEEYEIAKEFVTELALEVAEEMGEPPSLACVPGNHDVDRSKISKLVRRALEAGWPEVEEDFFDDPSDECRLSIECAFENYLNWVRSAPANLITVDNRGLLPGDFSGRLEKEGVTLGVLGLNSTYRHVSDWATKNSLSLPARQIQAAAGGDVTRWASSVDVGIVMTHHPASWIQDGGGLQDSIFYEGSPIQAHLCGHLHERRQGSHGLATVTENFYFQGESLFGYEEYRDGKKRLHGFSIASIQVEEKCASMQIYPRSADILDTGAWRFDRSSRFGLPKGKNASKPIELSRRESKGAGGTRPISSAPAQPSELRTELDLTRIKTLFETAISSGTATLVLGDVAAEPGGSPAITDLRYKYLDIVELEKSSNSTASIQQLYSLAVSIDPVKAVEITGEFVGSCTNYEAVTLLRLLNAPWLRVVDAGSRDLRSIGTNGKPITESYDVIDAVNESFKLPSLTAPTIVANLGPRLGRAITSEAEQRPEGSDRGWDDYVARTIVRIPCVFVSDSDPDDAYWQLVENLWRSSSLATAPPAFFVCADLSDRRQKLLQMYNVNWIPIGVRQFVEEWAPTSNARIAEGRNRLERRQNPVKAQHELNVALKRTHAGNGSSDYLRGNQPTWGDVINGFAVRLSFAERILTLINQDAGIILVGNTAGAGRTTALMQVALQLEADGRKVAWIESRTNQQVERISNLVDEVVEDDFEIVFVDDADGFGERSADLISDLRNASKSKRQVVIGCRTVKSHLFDSIPAIRKLDDFSLTESDVKALVALLRKKNAIPDKRMSNREIRDLLLVDSGRQLLAGMIQVTFGVQFKQKIESECGALSKSALLMYGVVCVVSAEGESITDEQALAATVGASNAVQSWLDFSMLVDKKLITSVDGLYYEARHRVIAEEVVNYLRRLGLLGSVIRGAVGAFAAAAGHVRDNSRPERRVLVRLLGHTYLRDNKLSQEETRQVYESVEARLDGDFHYWLQRGSFELENGDIRLALRALMSARTLAGGESDKKVLTTYARVRLGLAGFSRSSESSVLAMEALDDLHKVIKVHGVTSPHTFVVMCDEAVPWLVGADIGRTSKLDYAIVTKQHLESPIALRLELEDSRIARARTKAIAKLDGLIASLAE